MKILSIIIIICIRKCVADTCGIDKASSETVSSGIANIEWYPWMGLLVYPADIKDGMPQTSTVVLITSQLALATALEVDKFPKEDFRERSRVVLGFNCSTAHRFRVLEYVFHPDFNKNYYSALAMVQIERSSKQEVMPICSPPKSFKEQEVYAMTLKHDCTSGVVRIYKMEYVELDQCKDYYRRNDLDIQSLWPKHTSCAKSLNGGSCMWRSGTVLVTKQEGKWRLLGVGVYGPGCEAPARFLDYGRYHDWVRRSIARVGRVAITRMDSDFLILRRSTHHIQRYGLCDIEEIKDEIYSEATDLLTDKYLKPTKGKAHYNLTLVSKSDYSCIILRVKQGTMKDKGSLKLHRWCHTPYAMCGSANTLTVFFNVEITFHNTMEFLVSVYGKEYRYVNFKRLLYYINQKKPFPPLPWDKSLGIPWQDYND